MVYRILDLSEVNTGKSSDPSCWMRMWLKWL